MKKYPLRTNDAIGKGNGKLLIGYDVGYRSIGWAVLGIDKELPEVMGTGVVIFGADDCLAVKRRGYRRQRRHARSTRQRIARIERLLVQVGVLKQEKIEEKHKQGGGHFAPWLLAARVLASGGKAEHLLGWPELWDVIRWYAHNRGYDGNRRWSGAEEAARAEDTEKEKKAIALMEEYGTETMAETVCATLDVKPFDAKVALKKRYKGQNAAFPRKTVEKEVRKILEAHGEKLPEISAAFMAMLFDDWRALSVEGLRLPKRFEGGLLFGQLVPRFENRIITKCPISGEKVPSKNKAEFLQYRWSMVLANIRVAKEDEQELRPLSAKERRQVDRKMQEKGALTRKELKDFVKEVSGCVRSNLETMLMHPEAEKSLLANPVQKTVLSGRLGIIWPKLAYPVQKRVRDRLSRFHAMTLADVRKVAERDVESLRKFDEEIDTFVEGAKSRRGKNDAAITRETVLSERHEIKRLEGRAPYSSALLKKAVEEVMAGNDPTEKGGCLEFTEEMRRAQIFQDIDKQTNNHLVRHRLRILERLQRDLVKEYAGSDLARIGKIAIEVNRDLREFSGMTEKEIQTDIGRRLGNFNSVVTKLERDLAGKTYNGKPIELTAGLIRKARIAEDLGWKCPYTGQGYDAMELVARTVDKDHIIPRSQKATDALDALVITFSEVNKMKGNRTALKFILDEGGKPVAGRPQLTVFPVKKYEEFVKGLDGFKGHDDDKKRKKRRKDALMIENYNERDFVPRDLTVTSQLVRLGAQMVKRPFLEEERKPATVVSLPGSVTAEVRKTWKLMKCLELAAPNILESDGKTPKTKDEIRGITHLHHALDACVLTLATHMLPNTGRLWELMVKRKLNEEEKNQLRQTGLFDFNAEGRFQLHDLAVKVQEQIRQRLAEKRVVQHIPADMTGLRVEENTRGIVAIKDRRATLRQSKRDENGRVWKETSEPEGKLVGVSPTNGSSKLKPMRGARVITENYGLAILDNASDAEERFVIIPWHKVWHRIDALREKNGGQRPRILRNGMLIKFKEKNLEDIWRVFSIKNTNRGVMVDIGPPEGTEFSRNNNRVSSLIKGDMKILPLSLSGTMKAL